MDQHVAWFLSEVADSPGQEPESLDDRYLNYALGVIAGLLSCDTDHALDALLSALADPVNVSRLLQAKARRGSGDFSPYMLTIPGPEGAFLDLTLSPRPVFGDDGCLLGHTAAISLAPPPPVAANIHQPTLKAGRMGFWEYYPEQELFIMDPAFKDLLGYQDSDIEDTLEEFAKLVHTKDWNSLTQSLAEFLEAPRGVFEAELRMLHKTGKLVWTMFRGATMPESNEGKRMGGTCVDITERVAAEQAIELERLRLYNLLDRLPAYVCLLDQTHVIRFVNRFFRDHFGEAEGRPCHEVLHYCQTPGGPCPTFDVFETRSLAVWEWEDVAGNRIFRVFDYPFEDLDGSPLVLELGIDITQLKQALTALSTSEARYRSITDNLPLGLAVVGRDLAITAANPTFSEWFLPHGGQSRSICNVILCGRSSPESDCPCRRAFTSGRVVESSQSLRLPKSSPSPLKGVRHFHLTHCPIRNQEGEVDTVLLMAEDVTDKERMQDWLAKVHRLEALSAMAAGVAHEINQPLNALQLYASGLEMLLEQSDHVDTDTIRDRLSWIVNETSRIDDIITNMRTLVREEKTSDLGPVSLNDAVRQVLSVLGAQLENHGITLKTSFDPLLPPVRANAVQLEQVVMNITVNAIQALDSIEEDDGRQRLITVSTFMDSTHPSLCIEDNGPGIGGMEDRIFDPFFTTKESHVSMGLGLALTHTFVSNWGGEINAAGSGQGGALFLVRLLPGEDMEKG